jgi:hypothetical protein
MHLQPSCANLYGGPGFVIASTSTSRSKFFERDSTESKREHEAYSLIGACRVSHNGVKFVRTVLDSFHLDFADGSYQCLVH